MSLLTLAWIAISTLRLRSRHNFKAVGVATAWCSDWPMTCPPRTEEDWVGAYWVCGADMMLRMEDG